MWPILLALVEDLVDIAMVIAIAAVVIVAFLIALYLWALRRAREASGTPLVEMDGEEDRERRLELP